MSKIKQLLPTVSEVCTFGRLQGRSWVNASNASHEITSAGGMMWFAKSDSETAAGVYDERFPSGDEVTRQGLMESTDVSFCFHVLKVSRGVFFKRIGWVCNVSVMFNNLEVYLGSTVFNDLVSIVEFADRLDEDNSAVLALVGGTDAALARWMLQ